MASLDEIKRMLTHTPVFDQMENGYVGGKCAEFCKIITPYLKSWGVPAIEMYMADGPVHAVIYALSDDQGIILIDPTAHQFRLLDVENAPKSWVCMPIDEAFETFKGSRAQRYWQECTYAAMPDFHRMYGRNLPPDDLQLLEYLTPRLKFGLNMELHHHAYSDEQHARMAFSLLQNVMTYSEGKGFQHPLISYAVPHEAPSPDELLARLATEEHDRTLYVEAQFAQETREAIYSRFAPEFLRTMPLEVIPNR